MKPIIQRLWIVMVILCQSFSASAYDFEVDGLRYTIISSTSLTCKLVNNRDANYSGDIIIPPVVTYNGKELTVTSIGYMAFERCAELTSVIIPNTVTSIESYAFAYLFDQLSELIIPSSVISIGRGVLQGTYLNEVRIPNTVMKLGACPFDQGRIKSIIFEDGDSPLEFGGNGGANHGKGFIGYLAECECENLHLGREFIYENGYVHSPCLGASTIKTVTFGPSIKKIPRHAFSGCSSIKSLTIPETIISIGDGAFDDCLALDSVKFEDSETEIEIGQYTTNTGKGHGSVFYNYYSNAGNRGIQTLYLGRNFKCQFSLLNDDSHLQSLIIGKYVTDATGIFYVTWNGSGTQRTIYDSSLSTIKSYAENPPTLDDLTEGRYATITPIIPIGTKSAYESVPSWSKFWNFTESDLSSITPTIVNDIEYPISYYLLNGIKVTEEPSSGLYIRKQGNKVTKIIK